MKMIRLSSLMMGLLLAGVAYASPVKIMTSGEGDCEHPDRSICIYLSTQILGAQPGSNYYLKAMTLIEGTDHGTPVVIPVPGSIGYDGTSDVFWMSAEAYQPDTTVDSIKVNITTFTVNNNATAIDSSCTSLLAAGTGKYNLQISGDTNTNLIKCSIQQF
jgi:hypothetical protein